MFVLKFVKLLRRNLVISSLLVILTVLICRLFINRTFPVFNSNSSDDGIDLPVIMYHAIMEDKSRVGKYVITPELFESDLKYLKENGYTPILMDDLIKYTEDFFAILPEKPILITFDDGYYSNYFYAFPLLKKYNMKAVISILGKYSNEMPASEKQNPRYSHVSWDQMREMVDSGLVEIQNHTYNMHTRTSARVGAKKNKNESLSEYERVLANDVLKLQDLIYQNLGYTPTTFAYPFGEYTDSADEILKSFGFKVVLRCRERPNKITKGQDFIQLNRYNRGYGESSERFFNKIK